MNKKDAKKFFYELSSRMGVSEKEAESYYLSLVRYIVYELRTKEVIELPELGKMRLKRYITPKLRMKNLNNAKNDYSRQYSKKKIKFKVKDKLINFLNKYDE